jgi:outer membrane protein TolC
MKRYCCMLLFLFPLAQVHGQAGKLVYSLDSAIHLGIENNPEMKSASQKVRAASGRFWSALAPPPAELSATNDYVPTGERLSAWGEKTVGVSQTIEFPTNYYFRASKFSKETEIARQGFAQAKLTVIAVIKSAYFTALALQEQVKIAQENLSIAEDFVKKAEIRFSVGEGTNLERLTARVQHAEARNLCEVRSNRLVSAFAALGFALGHGKGAASGYQLTDTLGCGPFNFTDGDLTEDAVRYNPQLKISRLRTGSLSAERALAWSGVLPEVNIGFFTKQVRGDARDYYGASLGISVPVWFMLDQRGKIQEASANAAAAAFDLRTAENTVVLKTNGALSEFRNAERQVALYRKEILPQADEIFRTASKSYEAGEITYIEFLQAQQTIITARSCFVDALLAYNLSVVSLEEAIGKTIK